MIWSGVNKTGGVKMFFSETQMYMHERIAEDCAVVFLIANHGPTHSLPTSTDST